jgi:hypothetical protein
MTMQDDLSTPSSERSLYIPVLIGLVALVGFLSFQAVELWWARGAFIAQREGQNIAYANSDKIRQQFATVASKTAQLADRGDADAQAIVDAYAKRGVKFVAPKAQAPAPAAPKP